MSTVNTIHKPHGGLTIRIELPLYNDWSTS